MTANDAFTENLAEHLRDSYDVVDRIVLNGYFRFAHGDNTLPTGDMVGKTRVGGLDINKQRTRAVMEAGVGLASNHGGFTAAEHAEVVRRLLAKTQPDYRPSQSAYDIKKLRCKGMVQKVEPNSRRYEATTEGLRMMAAIVALRAKVLRPLLGASGRPCPNRPPRYRKTVDACHKAIHYEMGRLFAVLHLAA
jgi:hypothetical protein